MGSGNPSHAARRFALAVVAVVLAWASRVALSALWGTGALAFITFYPAVLLAAWYGRLAPGLLAVALSVALSTEFVFGPEGPVPAGAGRIAGLGVFTAVSLFMVLAMEAMHRARDRALAELFIRRQSEEAAEAVARRQERLYRFAEAAHRADSLNALYDAALDAILPALQCDRVAILLFDASDRMRFTVWRGLSDRYRRAVEGHSPWRLGEQNPAPIGIGDIETADIDDALREAVKSEGIGAMAFIPLATGGGLIGNLMAYRDLPLAWTDEELDLAVAIGRQLASGIARKLVEQALSETQERAEHAREQLLVREQQLREGAEEANRTKDEFLATLSHELRNPLNVIMGYSEVLLRIPEARESLTLRRIGEALKRNALVQSYLIRDLLELSRLRSGMVSLNLETVDLHTAVRHSVEAVRAEACAKNLSIAIEATDDAVFVRGDSTRLEQVASNLLTNAVKFTPANGAISIRIRRDPPDAVLVVEDTGEGIDPLFLPHVFEMFRQADASAGRAHSGLGIGLALVRQLVGVHGGSVTAHSDGRGQGARFTVRLSLVEAAPAQAMPEFETRPAALLGLRVLVVDDSEDTAQMLSHLLSAHGGAAATARSADEALRMARDEPWDAVVSDISMSGMDGFELLTKLRSIKGCERLPVMALTGYGQEGDVQRARRAGFLAHFTKPLNVDGMLEILLRVREEKRSAESASAVT